MAPKLIRLRDAPAYLGMNINYFNDVVRPYLAEIPIGSHGIAFDRLELDEWAEQYKKLNGRPAKLSMPSALDINDGSMGNNLFKNRASINAFEKAIKQAIS